MNNDSTVLIDSVYNSYNGSLGYNFNSANIVRAGYMYSLMKYDDGNESRGDREYAEYEKYYTKQFRSLLQGGYDYIKTSNGESLNTRWMASLIDDVNKNNQLNITYLKENTISNIYNDTFKNWNISANLRREISDRTGINISLFYGKGSYDISRVTVKLGGVSIILGFIVNEFVNFNIGYNYTRNSSTAPASEENIYYRNQVSLGLSAVY